MLQAVKPRHAKPFKMLDSMKGINRDIGGGHVVDIGAHAVLDNGPSSVNQSDNSEMINVFLISATCF